MITLEYLDGNANSSISRMIVVNTLEFLCKTELTPDKIKKIRFFFIYRNNDELHCNSNNKHEGEKIHHPNHAPSLYKKKPSHLAEEVTEGESGCRGNCHGSRGRRRGSRRGRGRSRGLGGDGRSHDHCEGDEPQLEGGLHCCYLKN